MTSESEANWINFSPVGCDPRGNDKKKIKSNHQMKSFVTTEGAESRVGISRVKCVRPNQVTSGSISLLANQMEMQSQQQHAVVVVDK